MPKKATTNKSSETARVTVGIDYSLSCPAMCVHVGNEFSIKNCVFFYKIDTKKYVGLFWQGRILGEAIGKTDGPIDRYVDLAEFFMNQIPADNPVIGIEDYAMQASGRVFHIAENTAILKFLLFRAGFPYITIPPTVIKKFATGKGNSNKDAMFAQFKHDTVKDLDLTEELRYAKSAIGSPLGDIVDSFYICKYTFFNNKE